jgi:flagella basal body P-ring formation protein FlgA
MRLLRLLLSALLLITLCPAALAADSAAIRQAVEEFLRGQVKDLPGNPTPVIGKIDAERLAGSCEGLTVSMNGPRRWGATQVVVACRGGTQRLFVQVDIPVVAEYMVAARAVGAGQKLTDADVGGQVGRLPNDVLLDRSQVVGRIAKNSLAPGTPLRADMFRQAWVVQQGQMVKIVVVGRGFEVTKEGRALHNAAVGQDTQVRVDSATTVTGVARADGAVEVRN